MSSGLHVRFQSDSPTYYINYTLFFPTLDWYDMPSTSYGGCDLLTFDESTDSWRWVGICRTISYPVSSGLISIPELSTRMRKYILFLPLYNRVLEFNIGVPRGKALLSDSSVVAKKPIVWYGTSIAQGSVASRPGRSFTNMLTISLNRPVLNFGFAGNGMMEIEVQQFLNKIDAAAFVIDCLPNMNSSMVANRTVPLVKYIRSSHPQVPIVLVEGTTYSQTWLFKSLRDYQAEKRAALSTAYFQLQQQQVPNIFYVHGNDLFGFEESDSPTIEGTHPTELGIAQIAAFYNRFLPTVLGPN